MTTRGARVARGLGAASVAVFVAAFAHTASGGSTPGFAGLALTFAFSALACVALAGRRLSRWRIALSVVLSQAVFHLLFQLFGSGAAGSTHGAPAVGSGMRMPGMASVVTAVSGAGDAHPLPAATTLVDAASTSMAQTPADLALMWLAHLTAATVTVVALIWGETAIRALVAAAGIALRRWFRPLTITVTVGPTWAPTASEAPQRRRAEHFLLTGLRHRGPPALLRAVA